MGRATGFLEFDRQENSAAEPLERIKNYNEFHTAISDEERRRQAARCMDCGVPFCQNGKPICGMISGCPLGNLIPEWNELIYRGRPELALSRLLMTNAFPEFTSRVCPALCEKACTCGLNGDAVSVRENENYIIEYGFANGLVKAQPPAVRSGKRIAVIGSGPAGLAAAQTLGRRGHTVTVYEREDRVGGLLMYGIPNMKLEKQIIDRRVKLMQGEGVEFVTGVNVGADLPAEQIAAENDAVILACGASQPRDISANGRESEGIMFAVEFLKNVTKGLLSGDPESIVSARGKNVVVIGGGDTGNDCVGSCVRQGCASVTQLEMMPKLPDVRAESNPWPEWPRVCKTDYGQEEAAAVFGSDPRIYCTTVKEFIADESGRLCAVKLVSLDFSSGRPQEIEGSERVIDCELCLIAAGFLGSESYVSEAFEAPVNGRGNIVSDDPTSHRLGGKLFSAGDVRIGQSLVVRAIREGIDAAREVDEFLMGYTNL